MKTIQVTAKNVEKAIKEGLAQLNATQDQVDIKILDEGGLFKKAKVELTLEEPEVKEEPKKETKKETPSPKTKSQEKPAVKEKPAKVEKVEKPEPKVEKETKVEEKTTETKKQVNENVDDARVVGGEFLKGLFNQLNIETVISSTKTNDGISYNVKGDRVNDLIGYRGETLNSLQYILNMVLKNAGYKTRAFLDVENYKQRRQDTLVSLAERLARKAVKLNKPIELEPMNAYERRIIHEALSKNDSVTTHSEGEEPNRHLIISPKQ